MAPLVDQPQGQVELWGLPFDLAVALIGLIGALLGALIGAGVTLGVARWQAKQELRQTRLDRLDALVAELHLYSMQMARNQHSAASALTGREREVEVLVDTAGMAMARARGVSPRFGQLVDEGMQFILDQIQEPWLHALDETEPSRTATLTPSQVFTANRAVSRAAFALAGVTGKWLRGGDALEADNAFTWRRALEIVDNEAGT